ncbi:MAG TPA: S9 family peptidase [Bryobacteraceae bacterium]|nr:S9 family peptidase [Bryobacteraceae bacterium]
MLRYWLICLSLAAPLCAAPGMDIETMMRIKRVSDPQLSPDGKTLAFAVQGVDLTENKKTTQIYTVPLSGGTPRAITTEGSNDRPRWSPDSSQIAFVSVRNGASQVWLMDADGNNARQVTTLATEAAGVLFFPDGKRLLFTSEVYPDCSDVACNERTLQEEASNKSKARTYTSLLYRHWNQWGSKRKSHLFAISTEGTELKDMTPGRFEVPTFSLGGQDGYAISPDGKEICYVMNGENDQALSTNSDLWTVAADGGDPQKITMTPGADVGPVYSPDGQWLAWRGQKMAGYESDRWRLFVIKRKDGRVRDLSEALDRNVEGIFWSPDSTRLFYTLEDRGRQGIQMLAINGTSGARSIVSGSATYDDVQLTPDGKTMLYTMQTGSKPVEIYRVNAGDGKPEPMTRLNDDLLAGLTLPAFEDLNVTGAEGAKVHSFVLKPAGFDAKQKYPVLFFIHGGPQGAWHESWSYRWNPQIFADAGFVVVMPNPRGSTGYGQKFTDDINNDWGGKVYEDIMATVDHVATQPWADPERFAAAGGSFGGYMVNWMLGHTTRFKALVSHAGVYDLRSMAGETEELWFPLWEFKGMPWDNPETYAKWSPSFYVTAFQTPTLVFHGEQDYRVPVGQGLQLFTALQMKKVPSKLVLFPDEGHWILKPQNSVAWHKNFVDWITEWTKKPAAKP